MANTTNNFSQIQVSIGGYPVYDPPDPKMFTNVIIFHSGAARPGVFRFIMRNGDASKLLLLPVTTVVITVSKTGADTSTTGFQAVPSYMRLVESTFTGLADANSTNTRDGANQMVELTLLDLRCNLTQPVSQAFNVQVEDFSWDTANLRPFFYPSTLNSGAQYTWSDILTLPIFSSSRAINNISLALASMPWNPRNLIFDNVPLGRAIDEIAGRLGYVAGYDAVNSGVDLFPISNQYKQSMAHYNHTVLSLAMTDDNALIGGSDVSEGSGAYMSALRLPGTIDFSFRGVNFDNGNKDPFANRAYISSIPVTLASNASYNVTPQAAVGTNTIAWSIGDYVAIRSNGAWVNQAECDVVANAMMPVIAQRMALSMVYGQYAGFYPLQTDGCIRGIMYHFGLNGTTTTVRINNDSAFSVQDEITHALDGVANIRLVGLGEANVSSTTSGSRVVWSQTNTKAIKVIVKNNGGAAGSASSTINATYDLYSILDTGFNTKLNIAGALPPIFNRVALSPPNTPYAIAVNGSIADAFYDATGAIQLWLVQETPTWATC